MLGNINKLGLPCGFSRLSFALMDLKDNIALSLSLLCPAVGCYRLI